MESQYNKMEADWFKIEYLIGPPVFLLLIFITLVLHELGHYFAARMFKMPVDSIVIGRGRTLKHWDDKHGTRWSIRRLPLGAHVHLQGLEGLSEGGAFAAQPFWKRTVTILAGPLANLAILPFLFFAFYMLVGQPSTPPVLVGVEPGLAADKAGMQPGDRFLAVDGQPVANFQDIWRVAYSKGAVQSIYTIQRGDKIFDLPFTPDWTEYKDEDGIERKNARFGVTWQHSPLKLSAIMSVADQNTQDDEDKARALLLKNMDKEVIVGFKGPDGKEKPARVRLSSALNPNLDNPNHDDYERIFFGQTRGNIYLDRPAFEHAAQALRKSAAMIRNIASVPFQLLPIDSYKLKDSNEVMHEDTRILNMLYTYMHLFALTCVVIALVNLLPLPYMDGGHLLTQIIERILKKPMSRKSKAVLFALIFFSLYAVIAVSNMNKVPGYIDSRLKKVHEFIEERQPKDRDEAING
ncbi:MAG: site-2 protease family protein [Alphaproteobacteria bacterium]|nr:site-2 protease family protein [Alphaproteobacteria bacterium]